MSATLSSVNILQAKTWWNKGSGHILQASEIINQSSHSLVIVEELYIDRLALFSLLHHLNSPVDLIILNQNLDHAYIPSGYQNYFLFRPSEYGAVPINLKKLSDAFEFKTGAISKYEGTPLFKFEQ